MWDAFSELPIGDSDGLHAIAVGGREDCFLAKEGDERPLFLFRIHQAEENVVSIKTKNIQLQPNLLCTVQIDGRSFEGEFLAVTCLSSERALISEFVDLFCIFCAESQKGFTADRIVSYVMSLIELFSVLTTSGRRAELGFWGELFVIASSSNVSSTIDAWHDQEGSLHDFVFGLDGIDAKATLQSVRTHRVSFEQVRSPNEGRLYLASLILNESEQGLSVSDLVAGIEDCEEVRARHIRKLHTIGMRTLGSLWRSDLQRKFCPTMARQSLRFFDVRALPKLVDKLPDGIGRVEYDLDLRFVQSTDELTSYSSDKLLMGGVRWLESKNLKR